MNRFLFIIFFMAFVKNGLLFSQTLQVSLSPDMSKVDRSTSDGTATIFFDSSISDLSIICTDDNTNEPIIKINKNLWFIHVDVKKSMEEIGVCLRHFTLKCPTSADYQLTINSISPSQVLYYTVSVPNKLEPDYLKEKAKSIAAKAITAIGEGKKYLAMQLALQALPPNYPYTVEAEAALRMACPNSNVLLQGHTKAVKTAYFSPDGNRILSTSDDDSLRIWNANTGECVQMIVPDSTHLLKSRYFDPNLKGNILGISIEGDYNNKPISATYYRDSAHVLKTFLGGNVVIESISKKKFRKSFKRNGHMFKNLLFAACCATSSPNGKRIAAAYTDGSIVIWNTNASICKEMKGHLKKATSVSFSPDNKLVVSGSEDRTVRIWNEKKGKCIKVLEGHNSCVNSVSFSPNGTQIASASGDILSGDNSIRIWDVNTGKCIHKLEGHSSIVNSISFSSDGKYVISASGDVLVNDNTIRIWDVETGTCIQILKGHSGRVNSAVFSPDGKRIVSASEDKNVIIWAFPPLQQLIDFTRLHLNNESGTPEEQNVDALE